MTGKIAAFSAGLVLSQASAAAGELVAPLRTAPIELGEGEYHAATLTGAWRLWSPAPDFGGVSGLLVHGRQVVAVTDQGYWISGRRSNVGGLEPEITIARMLGPDGNALPKDKSDAEDLTRRRGQLFVSFEGDPPRLGAHLGDGRIKDLADLRLDAPVHPNRGIEALVTLADGVLLAIGEPQEDEDFPLYILGHDGLELAGRLPRLSPHKVNGADVGPDGNFYLVQRHLVPDWLLVRLGHWLLGTETSRGFSVMVVRYRPGDDGLPDPSTAEILATWENGSGIGNMEGIAAFRDSAGGPVKLWLISDNDLKPQRQTILVELELR